MPVQIPLDPKHLDGVAKLVEAMEILGVQVTQAVTRPEAPAEVGGVQPHVRGALNAQPVYGHFIPIDEITRESLKEVTIKLEHAAAAEKAKLIAGVLGKPGKGFSGLEQGIRLQQLQINGWEIIDL